MAEAMLIGAGIGAGGAMLSGQDPLKGAALGGAMGGATAGFGSAGVASGAGASAGAQGASHLAQTGAQQAASNAAAGGLSSQIGGGFQNATGLTNRDMTMMGVNQGLSAMQSTPQQQIQHAPVNISRPQVDLSQGVSPMSSNPRIKRLKMEGLL